MPNFEVFREVNPIKKPYHIAIAVLAKTYLKFLPSTKVIAITGSMGKTLTQNAIYSVLCQKYNVAVGNENLDPTFRIPQTILKAKPNNDYLVLEYGVEHPGDMDYYLWLAKPNIAVVTNIAKTHTLYFKNEQGVFGEKVKLVESLGSGNKALLNSGDEMVVKMKQRTKAKILWFGEKSNLVRISNFSQDLNGSKFEISYHGKKIKTAWPIIGKHQLLSAYAAATLGVSEGLSLVQITRGLAKIKQPLHRLNLIKYKNFTIIDDTYNSSPKAAKESLQTLNDLTQNSKKIAVLGEMKDLGEISTIAHANLGREIAKIKVDYLITIGNVAKLIEKGAKANNFKGVCVNVPSTHDAVNELKKIVKKDSLILVKGSRHAHLERVVDALINKSTQISCHHCANLK